MSCLGSFLLYPIMGKRRSGNRPSRRKRKKRTSQKGGASVRTVNRILNRGPSATDKAAYVVSMLLSGPAPGFGTLGRLLGKQVLKGVMDNVNHYRGRRWSWKELSITYTINSHTGCAWRSGTLCTNTKPRINSNRTTGYLWAWNTTCFATKSSRTGFLYIRGSSTSWPLWDFTKEDIQNTFGGNCTFSTFQTLGSSTTPTFSTSSCYV